MKKGNEGCDMNRKYEKFKLVGGTLLAFFILVAVSGIAFLQNRYADENILEDELLEIHGDEKFHYVKTGITYWQYKDTEGEPSIDGSGKRWNEVGYQTEGWKEAKGSFGSYYGELNDRVGKYPSNLLNYYSAKKKALPVYYFRTEFEVEDGGELFQLLGEIQFDDSVIIYLNGTEIYKDNEPTEGYEPGTGYGAEKGVETSWNRVFTVENTAVLKNGTNCIAVEVHQMHEDSSDIYFDFKEFKGTPEWNGVETLEANGLILQPGDTNSQMLVNWLAPQKGGYNVQYCRKVEDFLNYTELEMERVEIEGQYCYKARLSNLRAGETYSYRLCDRKTGARSEVFEFTTAKQGVGVNFLFAGDPQIGAGESAQQDGEAWKRTLEVGKQILPKAEFLISAGDQCDSSKTDIAIEEYYEFRSPDELKNIPVAVNKGNHDTVKEIYEEQFMPPGVQNDANYYFARDGVLFFALNSNSRSYATQIEYLKKAIQNTNPEWIVVTMHYSMFSAGPHSDEEKMLNLRKAYNKAFSELNVDLVLSGHDHLYARTYLMEGMKSTGNASGLKKRGETLYLSGTSSTGSKFYEEESGEKDYIAFYDGKTEKTPLISAITIQDKTLTIKTVRTTNMSVFDEITIRK